jgi:hypothetical protein
MGAYVTIEDIQTHGFQLDQRDSARIESIAEMISRLFDQACGLPGGYFDKYADGASATARIFYGNGTDTLDIDPYKTSSITSVAMPTGWTVPSYLELNSQTLRANDLQFGLVRTYGDNASRFSALTSHTITEEGANFNQFYVPEGWPDGIKVTVTAIWGYDAVPMEVKLACIESTIAALRGMDQAYMRVTNLETNQVSNASALTPRAQMLADGFNNSRVSFA